MGGGYMPPGIEVTKQALDDFKKIQEYMLSADALFPSLALAMQKVPHLTAKD